MPGEVITRAATAEDDQRIKAVWEDAFPPPTLGGTKTYLPYLKWLHEDNPDASSTATKFWLAEIDNDVIGVWGTTPVKFTINQESVDAVWSQNTAVASRGQRKGVGKKLFRFAKLNSPLYLGIGTTGQSYTMFAAEGVHFVEADPFWTLLISKRKALRRAAGAMARFRVSTAVTFLKQAIYSSTLSAQKDISVNDVQRFDGATDRFLNDLRIPVMASRNSGKLNWVLSNPRIRPVAFVAKSNGRVMGYAIMRQDGKILELLVSPGDKAAFRALAKSIMLWANKRGIEEIGGIVPPLLADLYSGVGFCHLINTFGLFYAYRDKEQRNPTLDDPRNWFISLADSDLFTFQMTE